MNLKELWPTQSVELLKELHILTRDGDLNQDSRRKLKQVQHLIQLITPHLNGLKSIADLGAGKSYLGFMLYDLWMKNNPETQLWAVERTEKLIARSKEIAKACDFSRCTFVAESILEAIQSTSLPEEIDVVTALHACDTATDEAIAFALKKNAKFIALVPCCQAEVARLLENFKTKNPTKSLWRHNLHRREFGSHLTNVLRCLFLESKGYKVRVTELIGWEHSMKNELIIAERVQKTNGLATQQLEKLLQEFPLEMRLWELTEAL
ncbi:MAG: SAM-dependent methyltransferase [Bdellovibrionota bacterium]